MPVIATAGHVDHGKSSLVQALTGIDPDRFAEEKRRGMTIDLGFAHTVLAGPKGDDGEPGPAAVEIGLVDVPGHVRFLRNMLAGVGAVSGCVFVVAATEGWKPQSEEHLRILEILGLRHGVIALTKVDLVDEGLCELATLEIAERVAGTFLDGAPILPVASPAGVGLPALRAALAEMVAATGDALDQGRPRLWVDRAFAAKGSGTVVTGTLAHGSLAVDDQVRIEPGGRTARIRSIQTHGTTCESIGPGHRVALNLSGIGHEEIGRGDAVVLPDTWWLSARADAELQVLGDIGHEVSRRGAHLMYIGAREVPVRMRVLGPASLAPGETGLVRLHLPVALPLRPGDRFVIREAGRGQTIGGGRVLDVDPVLSAARARPDGSVERLLAERAWVPRAQWPLLTDAAPPDVVGDWVVDPQVRAATEQRLRGAVEEAGPFGLEVVALDLRERAVLAALTEVEIDGGMARLAAAADPLADHPVLTLLREGGLAPATPADQDRGVLRQLARRALVWERDGVWFHTEAVAQAVEVVAQMLTDNPAGFTVSQFRERAGITRKHAVPLLAELDARALTRREGDLRIAGRRWPAS